MLHALILFLEIYEYDPSGKKCPTLKFKKQLGKYQYKFSTDEHVVFAKMKEGCDPVSVDIVGTENHIYLLTQDPEQRKQRNILVLDWKGNPVKLLKTGQRVMCLPLMKRTKWDMELFRTRKISLYHLNTICENLRNSLI